MTSFALLSDERRSHRIAWTIPPWIVTVFLLGLGVPYMVGGGSVLPLPAAYQAINVNLAAVGGMHTYGSVLTLFGLFLAEGLVQAFRPAGRIRVTQIANTCRAFGAFTVGPLASFIASWIATGVTTWTYLLFWVVLAGCAVVTVRQARHLPPPHDPDDGSPGGAA